MTESVAFTVLALTVGVFAFLIPFASHRTLLMVLSRRRVDEARAPWPSDELPVVTVQLPVFNERHVVRRLVDATCRIRYPRHLLEVQVLDDSTDETTAIVAERVAAWRARGVRIEHLRRTRREGFKAGALAAGTEVAAGEFLLVFDADFVPGPEIAHELLAPMRDPAVGMVQARWDHLNRTANRLTEAQANLLDGHFLYEQGGRYAGGRFFNFNGTAGMWRRRCLEEAGGWQADTLTEDLDLSYRAQIAGWRFAYLDDVGVPAEIPETVHALEVQQRRWAQGGVQTARKILPSLLRGPYRAAIKAEAVVHLLGHLAHPLTWSLAVLLFPSAVARRTLGLERLLGLDVLLFAAATVPFVVFYWSAGERRGRPRRGRLLGVLRTLSLGVGLSVPVSRAVLRGLRGTADPFVRTPKRGDAPALAYAGTVVPLDTALQLGMALLMTMYLVAAVAGAYWGQLPFILLFLSGYAGLGVPALLGDPGAVVSDGVVREEEEERQPQRRAQPSGLGPRSGRVVAVEAEVA